MQEHYKKFHRLSGEMRMHWLDGWGKATIGKMGPRDHIAHKLNDCGHEPADAFNDGQRAARLMRQTGARR